MHIQFIDGRTVHRRSMGGPHVFWSCTNPYWRISGVWAGPIFGKLIQPKFMSTYSVLVKFGVWAWSISGKLIQIWLNFLEIGLAHAPIFYKNWIGTLKIFADEFSGNRSSSCPGNSPIRVSTWSGHIWRKNWMSCPEIGLCHAPENWNFGKISGWVFQDLPIRANVY